jgi:hypothetical protein
MRSFCRPGIPGKTVVFFALNLENILNVGKIWLWQLNTQNSAKNPEIKIVFFHNFRQHFK